MVAWCTKEGHGTRIIPEGALQGVQFIQVRLFRASLSKSANPKLCRLPCTQTPHYVQVVGYIDQVKIDMLEGDYGGEMVRQDPGPKRVDGTRMLTAFSSPRTRTVCCFSEFVQLRTRPFLLNPRVLLLGADQRGNPLGGESEIPLLGRRGAL